MKYSMIWSVLLVMSITQAHALTVFDPQNFVQNFRTAIRQLEQIENQIKQLANQIEVIKRLDQNLLSLEGSISGDLKSRLNAIQRLIDQADQLALNVKETDQMFQKLYPQDYNQALSTDEMLQSVRERWQAQHSAFKLALQVQGQVIENIAEDKATLQDLLSQSQTAKGALQASQAGNQILGLSVHQLMQLQTLLVTYQRNEALRRAKESSAERMADANWNRMLGQN